LTHRWPQILPEEQAVLFSANASQSNWEGANIEVLSLKSGQRKIVQRGGYYGRYLPSGHLIYVRGGALYGVAFNAERLEPKGAPTMLLEDLAASDFGGGQFDFSGNGTFIYLSGKIPRMATRSIVWMDSAGKIQPLLSGPEGYSAPSISPDTKRLAVIVGLGQRDLSVYDLQREILTKVTFAGNAITGIWTPDGKHRLWHGTWQRQRV